MKQNKFTLLKLHLFLGMGIYFYSSPMITNPQRPDGFGAQFQTIIYSVIYAELNNMKFVYTPFRSIEHNYDNDSQFIQKKEWLINFIDNFDVHENRTTVHNGPFDWASILKYVHFFENNVTQCINSLALKKIKKIFRANKNIDNFFNNENFNIAIHLRRPNTHDVRITGAEIPDDVYVEIIKKLRIIYTSKNPLFHLYSQGSEDNFKAFKASDIVLHINEPVEDSFIAMVVADALVVAASSLSYVAGILSEGDIFYVPFWHVPLPHWKSVETLCALPKFNYWPKNIFVLFPNYKP